MQAVSNTKASPSGSDSTDEQQRQKKSHAKVRSGCTTCKARRIKCDEVKPTCGRCRLSGRPCNYAIPKTWLFDPSKEAGKLKAPTLVMPSSAMARGNPKEQRAYQFFREKTAPQFAGQRELPSRFWNQFIARSAQNEPLIHKLAVAMGARHEATVLRSEESAFVATKAYEAAISVLARNFTQLRMDVSLLCCALLMGYANLCEDVPATAAVHFSLGLKILREETISGHRPFIDSMGAYIEPMFGELELATAVFRIPSANVEVLGSPPQAAPTLPNSIADLYHAKQLLSSIHRWLLYIPILYKTTPTKLAAAMTSIDYSLAQWRQLVFSYSFKVYTTNIPEFHRARKMLFQYKLFVTCRGAAKNDIFLVSSKVKMLSIDFSQSYMTSVLFSLNRGVNDNSWHPLTAQPERDRDEVDIWPRGEPVGQDGNMNVVRITLGG